MEVHEHGALRFVVGAGGAVWTVSTPVKERLGRCYELSALRAAGGPNAESIFSSLGYEGSVLVHGTIQGVGVPAIGHAWVIEPNGDVWEPATNDTYPADVFEALFAAVIHVQYSPTEARMNMATTGVYGPWAEEAQVG